MSVTSPTLTQTITTDDYRSEIDANFAALQSFCDDVATALSADSREALSPYNLYFLDGAMRPDGIMGADSFAPSFDTDERILTLSHPTDVGSLCMIEDRIHRYSEAYTKDLADVLDDDNTWHRVAIGVKSEGAPSCSIVVVQSSGATDDEDADIDLLLWTFQGKRNGSAYDVKEVRLEATPLLSRDAFRDLFLFEHAVVLREAGALPAGGGALDCGLIAPWDCEIMGGYARLANTTAATDGVSIDVRAGSTSLIASEATWTAGDADTVKTLSANASASQVSAGTWIHVHVTSTEDVSDASDLTVVVKLRRIYQGVYA